MSHKMEAGEYECSNQWGQYWSLRTISSTCFCCTVHVFHSQKNSKSQSRNPTVTIQGVNSSLVGLFTCNSPDCYCNTFRIYVNTLSAVNNKQSKKYEAPLDKLTFLPLAQKHYASLSIMFSMKMNCFHVSSTEAALLCRGLRRWCAEYELTSFELFTVEH